MKNPGCTPGHTCAWYRKVAIWSNNGCSFHALTIVCTLNQFPSGTKDFSIALNLALLFKVSNPILTTLSPSRVPTKKSLVSGLYLK